MGFNKKEHLLDNISVLQLVFDLEKQNRLPSEAERKQLMQYSGFGGLKLVLNPAGSPSDINQWSKYERDLFSTTQELHRILYENASDEKQYHRYVESMRSSVLTAFYTPLPIIKSVENALREKGIVIERLLDPSAGTGAFIECFKHARTSVSAYEKEVLTGKILQKLYPDSNIRISGFERSP